ncbi:MAG: recombinase family protein [Elusimicrobia bacterium]|nr:recombinase family protein [Elusimicrobiota bacterium]
MDKIVRAAIYTRISNEEKARSESNSLEAQREICEHYIEVQQEKGWKFSSLYEDPGYSGKDMNRPAMQRLIADARAGKIDAIVTYKLDRLSRSLKDTYTFLELLKAQNVAFASATQSIDTSNSTGLLMVNILASFAQFEREIGVERTAARMASRAEKGRWNGGWYPMGYDYDKEKKMLVVSSGQSQFIRRIFQMTCEGFKPAEIKNKLNSQGFRTSARMVVRRNGQAKQVGQQKFDEDHVVNIVRNPVYKGFVKHKDKIYPGQHKAIVDEVLWAKANAALNSKSPRILKHKDEHVHLLKGLLHCGECGYGMTPYPAGKKDKDGNPYLYYSCIAIHPEGKDSKCKVRALSAREIENAIKDALRKIGDNKQLLEKMIQESNRECRETIQPLLKKQKDLRETIDELTQQIRRLVDIFKQKDLVSADLKAEYKKLLEDREKAQTALEKLQIDIDRRQQKTFDAEIVRKSLLYFDKTVEALSLEDQKELMQLLIKELSVYPYDPNQDRKPGEGAFATKIKTRWYKVKLALYEVPTDALNLEGASSENNQIGCGTRIRT